jgi:hypothetical protein
VAEPGAAAPGAPASGGEGADATAPPNSGEEPPGAIVPQPGAGSPDKPPEVMYTQADLTEGTTIRGTLTCDDCTGALLVRIEDASERPPTLLTQKSFSAVGAYSIQVPKNKTAIVMVIHDTNGDGQPTPGEDLGLWTGGLVDTSADAAEVDLTVGVMPDAPPVELEEPAAE